MGIMGWLTGRNEMESDVYANYDKVSTVTDKISTIVADMSSSIETIEKAVVALNSCNGVGEYVDPVDVSVINEVLNSCREQIAKIGTDITTKAESIKTYEEASWLEKGASTFTMVGAKVLEGSLKVFEDMGDGIVSVVGWVAPKDSGLEKACKTFVEKDLSHDAFNAYYNSEFAKKSLITEDSGGAFLSKLAGQFGTFIFLGNGISKLASNLSKSESSLLRSVGAFAKSEKRLDVLQASLEGMGVGTSEGLQKGLSMDEAAGGGVKRAAFQGATAWAVGTLVEKGKEIYKAKRAVNKATSTTGNTLVLASGSGTADDLVNGSTKIFNSSEDVAGRVVSQTDEAFEDVISKNVDNVVLGQGDDALRLVSKGDEAAEIVIKNADDVGGGAATQFKSSVTGIIDDDIEVLGEDAIEVVSKKASETASHIDNVISKQSDDVLRLVLKGDEVAGVAARNADRVVPEGFVSFKGEISVDDARRQLDEVFSVINKDGRVNIKMNEKRVNGIFKGKSPADASLTLIDDYYKQALGDDAYRIFKFSDSSALRNHQLDFLDSISSGNSDVINKLYAQKNNLLSFYDNFPVSENVAFDYLFRPEFAKKAIKANSNLFDNYLDDILSGKIDDQMLHNFKIDLDNEAGRIFTSEKMGGFMKTIGVDDKFTYDEISDIYMNYFADGSKVKKITGLDGVSPAKMTANSFSNTDVDVLKRYYNNSVTDIFVSKKLGSDAVLDSTSLYQEYLSYTGKNINDIIRQGGDAREIARQINAQLITGRTNKVNLIFRENGIDLDKIISNSSNPNAATDFKDYLINVGFKFSERADTQTQNVLKSAFDAVIDTPVIREQVDNRFLSGLYKYAGKEGLPASFDDAILKVLKSDDQLRAVKEISDGVTRCKTFEISSVLSKNSIFNSVIDDGVGNDIIKKIADSSDIYFSENAINQKMVSEIMQNPSLSALRNSDEFLGCVNDQLTRTFGSNGSSYTISRSELNDLISKGTNNYAGIVNNRIDNVLSDSLQSYNIAVQSGNAEQIKEALSSLRTQQKAVCQDLSSGLQKISGNSTIGGSVTTADKNFVEHILMFDQAAGQEGGGHYLSSLIQPYSSGVDVVQMGNQINLTAGPKNIYPKSMWGTDMTIQDIYDIMTNGTNYGSLVEKSIRGNGGYVLERIVTGIDGSNIKILTVVDGQNEIITCFPSKL